MPSHWAYVMAAYGIATVALFAYWRYLAGKAHALRHTGGRRRTP